MCGIFGFISKHGAGPDVARLKDIAIVTQTRGEHAFGLAWLAPTDRLATFKRPGAATDRLDDLERCRDATAVIGHCRFATHGSPQDNSNNHPHRAGRGWLVHNGVVQNYRALASRRALALETDCDSEVLGLLMARQRGTILQRAADAVAMTDGRLAILGLWRRPTRVLVVRRDNPLHFSQTPAGFYFASLAEGLPGRPALITDWNAWVITGDGMRLHFDGRAL